MSAQNGTSTIPVSDARRNSTASSSTAVAAAAAAAHDGQICASEDGVSTETVPDESHQKVQAVARLHPSWFKGKGAEAELKETAVSADPRLVTFKGQKIIFMGYLLKYGKTLFKSDWKKRFFVLTPDFLCKFPSRDDYMDGKNADTTIDLYECTVVTAEQETSQPFSFKITCPRFKAAEGSSVQPGFVLLAAENAWELVEWTKSIENHGTRGWQSLITEASFQKLHKVGSGSYGSVYQVKKLDTQKIYAMKILSKANFTEEAQLRALSNERRVLEAVSHAFIVRLHFAFQSDEEYFFVLDFMAGGDFFAFLKRHRKLEENQARFYAAEVLLALEYMHSYDPPIAYRDLKPENIMIGIDGHIKLTDFGFAKFFGDEGHQAFDSAGSPLRERSHSIVGSAFYIAPEIVNSSKSEGHDLSVDFWSFGCLIYEMVCGHALFADPKSVAMFQQMKKSGQISKDSTFPQFTMYRLLNTKESATFPSTVSKPLLSLLNTLLQRNPNLRCKSWSQVKQHEFFQSIDFTKLLEKKIDPPFVPSLSKGYQDISMFEDATAVEISIPRPASRHRQQEPSSPPDSRQVQGFHFQAKTSQILTESAKKTSVRLSEDSGRVSRIVVSDVPSFSGMRRSKSSESLDSAAKHPGSSSPSLEPAQPALPATAVALEQDTLQRSPNNSQKSNQGSPPFAVVAPKLTSAELAVQFFTSCGWDSKVAATCLMDALADAKNPQLADKKFQHAAALFSNEVTSAIL